MCLTCHMSHNVNKLQMQNIITEDGKIRQFCDQVVKCSLIKNIHEIGQSKYLYEGKEHFLSVALKTFCKTLNEFAIESIGSVAELHTKQQSNCNSKRFDIELITRSQDIKPIAVFL